MKKIIITIVSAIIAATMIGFAPVSAEGKEARNMASVVAAAKELSPDAINATSRCIDIDGTTYRYVLKLNASGSVDFSITESTDGLAALLYAITEATE